MQSAMCSSTLLTLAILTFIQCMRTGIAVSPGETTPDRVEIEIGGSANLTCSMNLHEPEFKRKDSKSLYFIEEETGRQIPRNDIEIVNKSTIIYMIRNASHQNRKYLCKIGMHAIGSIHVSVGTKPSNVNDFTCRTYDYSYMVCNFSIPQNTIDTQYYLSYTAENPSYIYFCKLDRQPTQGICNLTLEENNYKTNYEYYNFTLIGNNTLGTRKQNFRINHYESVIPRRPEFKLENITKKSAVLWWYMKMFIYYNKGLQYEVRLRPKNFDWMLYTDYELPTNRGPDYKLKLRNLPYAYYWYTVSIRIKTSMAHNDTKMWSEPYENDFQTLATRPETPPTTDVGSFYIESTETRMRLYWKQLPVYRHNGPNFQYIVTEVKRDGVVVDNIAPIQIDLISAIFPWDKKFNYEFTIKSRNDVGDSAESSSIIVPAMPSKTREKKSVQWVTNVYHEFNRTYTLSWSPPADVVDLVDYTIFWCPSRWGECNDTIQFEHVSKYTTKFNTKPQQQELSLNLAVSANYIDFNAGMQWTMCTAEVNNDLVKLKPEITAITSRTITIQWSPDLVCTSLLEGYNLTYCRLEEHNHAKCADKNTTKIVDKTAKKYVLTNLKPYSTYKIQMYMFSKLKVGIVSDPHINRTSEEAPLQPRNLKYRNITSNTVSISWMPPTLLNGVLKYYTVNVNNEQHIFNCSMAEEDNICDSDTKVINKKLEALSSYTNYKAFVTAHTVDRSRPSNDIHFTTLIGRPSNPRHMEPNSSNHTIMQWNPPDVPSGRVEFYEVAVIVWYRDQVLRQRISGVYGASACTVNIPLCIDTDYKHTLQVRAVNVADRINEIDRQVFTSNVTEDDADAKYYNDNEDLKCVGINTKYSESMQANEVAKYRNSHDYVLYRSVWEKGPIYGCAATTKLSRVTMVALLVVITSLAVMAAYYVARNKYKKMSDIKCVLPGEFHVMPYPTKSNAGLDNAISKMVADKELCQSKESLYNNENHHLLSSTGYDSGYLGHGNGVNGLIGGVTPCSIGKSSGYVGSDRSGDYSQHDGYVHESYVASFDQNTPPAVAAATDGAYMIMDVLQARTNEANKVNTHELSSTAATVDNGYVLPSQTEMSDLAKLSVAEVSDSSVYIKPSDIVDWQLIASANSPLTNAHAKVGDITSPPIDSGGYVQPQMLQKMQVQPSYEGYTTLEALGKPSETGIIPANTFAVSTQQPLPPISGYVTQKELSAFGQHSLS